MEHPLAMPFDDIDGHLDIQFPDRKIVQKKEGLGAADHDVVDAHGDQIDADAVVLVAKIGNFQLGADPVGGRNKHRVREPVITNGEQAAEAAYIGEHPAAESFRDQRFDGRDEGVAFIDINSRFGITGECCFCGLSPLFSSLCIGIQSVRQKTCSKRRITGVSEDV